MTKDIQSCEVRIFYSDNTEITVDMFLDLRKSIKEQVYQSFNALSEDYPQIKYFDWKVIGV